jgi:outer membrane lipoprotein-sorting protein
MLATIGLSADTNPDEILGKALKNYKDMTSFKADGNVLSKINMNGNDVEIKTDFTLLIQKPDLFLVTWSQNMGFIKQDGFVWNAGEGAYLYMGMKKSYAKLKDNQTALASATGISGGVANTMPSLVLQVNNVYSSFKNPKLVKEEKVEGEECYVISCENKHLSMIFWISKKRYIFIQIQNIIGKKDLTSKMNLTDEQLKESLKSMGQKPTKENIARMKKTMERAKEMTKSIKGSMTETYKNIVINKKYPKTDFKAKLPKDATLVDNLFKGMF